MARFKDEYLPDCINSYEAISAPRWSTDITTVDSGAEQANRRWLNPLNNYAIPQAVRDLQTLLALRDHWLVMAGPAYTFPFPDPLDLASVNVVKPGLAPVVTGTDQTIGTGDGITKVFQLIKTYTVGSYSYVRNIYHPIVDSVIITLNGNDPLSYSPQFTYSISRTTGEITFDIAPEAGMVIKAGYHFDVEVRFSDDQSFEGISKTWQHGGFSGINLVEVRPCED